MQTVRLTSPADLTAVVPHLLGFTPTQSLVVMSLRRPRGRLGLTMRFDLPGPELHGRLAQEVVARLIHDKAVWAAALIYTDQSPTTAGLPRRDLAELIETRWQDSGITTRDVLVVAANRWWSYRCDLPRCCPREGTPVVVTPASDVVAAESVLSGRAVLPSRVELVRSLEPVLPPGTPGSTRMVTASGTPLETAPGAAPGTAAGRTPHPVAEPAEAFAAAEQQQREDLAARGSAAVRQDALALWREVLDRYGSPPASVDQRQAAQLVVGLDDVGVRDEVLTEVLDREEPLFALLQDLVRRSPAPRDADVCTLLGTVAALRGDGGLANVALDRALRSDPDHSLARLIRVAVDGQLPPADIRGLLTSVRRLISIEQPPPRAELLDGEASQPSRVELDGGGMQGGRAQRRGNRRSHRRRPAA